MKTLLSLVALTFAVVGLNAAEPVNKKCPVSGKDVDTAKTSTYEKKTVAFCCGNCKAKFDKDPAKFADKLK